MPSPSAVPANAANATNASFGFVTENSGVYVAAAAVKVRTERRSLLLLLLPLLLPSHWLRLCLAATMIVHE